MIEILIRLGLLKFKLHFIIHYVLNSFSTNAKIIKCVKDKFFFFRKRSDTEFANQTSVLTFANMLTVYGAVKVLSPWSKCKYENVNFSTKVRYFLYFIIILDKKE